MKCLIIHSKNQLDFKYIKKFNYVIYYNLSGDLFRQIDSIIYCTKTNYKKLIKKCDELYFYNVETEMKNYFINDALFVQAKNYSIKTSDDDILHQHFKINVPVFLIFESIDNLNVEHFTNDLKNELEKKESCKIGVLSNSIWCDLYKFHRIDMKKILTNNNSIALIDSIYDLTNTLILKYNYDFIFLCLTGNFLSENDDSMFNKIFINAFKNLSEFDYTISLYPINTLIYNTLKPISNYIYKKYNLLQDYKCICNMYTIEEQLHSNNKNFQLEINKLNFNKRIYDYQKTQDIIYDIINKIEEKLNPDKKKYNIL